MSSMFEKSEFTGENGDISNWNVSNVTDMSSMFFRSKFTGDLSQWDVSNVENMRFIFSMSPIEKNPPTWYKQ